MKHLPTPVRTVCLALSWLIPAWVSAEENLPATSRPLNNAEGVFRFAILPDRTGGMRPGIYESAIAKLNLLQPEFVLSTGDLIDGYTTDPAVAAAQWDEFDGLVNRLDMRFHYVAGNHDVSNPVLLDAWRQRRGPPWWSFVHQNVLFLALHTEDRPLGGLGEAQLAWVRQTLAAHPDVRWTFLFMHRPLWRQADPAGFDQVHAALAGRRYTVFASHAHTYLKETRDGADHYILATAGGSSPLRGVEVGEFDHVTWVTMKPAGPVVANLTLDGILPDDVVTAATEPLLAALREGRWLRIPPVRRDGPDFSRLELPLEFVNPTDQPLRVRGSLVRAAGIEFMPARIERTVGPQQTLPVSVLVKAVSGSASLHALNEAGLEVTLTGSYDVAGRAVTLPATQTLRFDWKQTAPAAAEAITPDGALGEWPAALFTEVSRPMFIREAWDWHGAADGRFRFAVQQRDGRVFVAIETFDDRVLTAADPATLQDRLFVRLQSSAGPAAYEGVAGTTTENAVIRATATGLVAEFSLPLPAGDRSFHLNLGWVDADQPDNTKPAVLWWRDPAVAELGEFSLAP